MKNIMRVLRDIALVACVICFIIFLVDLFNNEDFSFTLPVIIIFIVCFIFFIFSKDKRNAFVDIWNILEIIFDLF